jgi:hypothetical protein
MILDIHQDLTQLSITTVRTLLRLTTLSPSCIQCAISLPFGTDLFPFVKDLCKTLKNHLDRNALPIRKLVGDGR